MYTRIEKSADINIIEDEIIALLNVELDTIIIGGHYMLMYDRKEDLLKPMIVEDLDDKEEIDYVRDEADKFPVRTFKISINLLKRLNLNGRVLLLVNDHLFLKDNKELAGRGGELRKKYYRDEKCFPDRFKSIIDKNKLEISETLFMNNNSRRQKMDILPKVSNFYSEQALRNKFDKYRKKEVIMDKSFVLKKGITSEDELYFKSNFTFNNSICLTHLGSCDCAGEVIELIIQLGEKGNKQVVFLVPNECYIPVNNGVESAISYINSVLNKKIIVIVLKGFGGKGLSSIVEKIDYTVHK